jgi:hypothetical protein
MEILAHVRPDLTSDLVARLWIISMAVSGSVLLELPIPYIFGLFVRPKFQGISPQNMTQNMV